MKNIMSCRSCVLKFPGNRNTWHSVPPRMLNTDVYPKQAEESCIFPHIKQITFSVLLESERDLRKQLAINNYIQEHQTLDEEQQIT